MVYFIRFRDLIIKDLLIFIWANLVYVLGFIRSDPNIFGPPSFDVNPHPTLILAWNPFLIFLKLIFRICLNWSSSNRSSLRLLSGVHCEFSLLLLPSLCPRCESEELRLKWVFHCILLMNSTILSIRDRMNSCFPGDRIFFEEYSGVNLSIFHVFLIFLRFFLLKFSTECSTSSK